MLGPCQRNILLIWNCFFSNRALAKKRQEADMYGKALFDFRIERFLRVTRVTRVVASSCFWTSDIRHQTSDIKSDLRPQTSDIKSDIRHQKPPETQIIPDTVTQNRILLIVHAPSSSSRAYNLTRFLNLIVNSQYLCPSFPSVPSSSVLHRTILFPHKITTHSLGKVSTRQHPVQYADVTG